MSLRPLTRLLGAALLALTFVGLSAPASSAANKTIKSPKKTSPYFAVLDGLKLVRDGKFDAWVDKWCSKKQLCYNDKSISSLKRYNLKALKRVAPQCIKDGGSLVVTRVVGDPAKDEALKIFVLCNPKGMPRPFHLVKEKGWKFKRI